VDAAKRKRQVAEGASKTGAPPGPLTDLLFEGTHNARLLDVTEFRSSISASIIPIRSQSATRESAQDDTQPDSSSDRGRQGAARGASWPEGTPADAVSIRPECRLLAFRQNRDCRRDRHPASFCMHCRLPGLAPRLFLPTHTLTVKPLRAIPSHRRLCFPTYILPTRDHRARRACIKL
jgi:hypothetical protein